MSQTILDVARDLVGHGIAVLPVPPDGSKHPHILGAAQQPQLFKSYLRTLPTERELELWFADENVGLCLETGQISGGLACLDIDHPELAEAWLERMAKVAPKVLSKLALVKTPSGLHVWFRSSDSLANATVVHAPPNPNGTRSLAQLWGEGGRCMHPASPGPCHPSGERYELFQGNFHAMPRLARDEVDCVSCTAVSFSQVWRPGGQTRYTPKKLKKLGFTKAYESQGQSFWRYKDWRQGFQLFFDASGTLFCCCSLTQLGLQMFHCYSTL